MKYKFERIDNDTTKLTYKDKEFEIKRDVDLTRKMQGLYATARMKMMVDLTKQGMTKKDLTIERKENGKTYYDNTNAQEVENGYVGIASMELYDKLCQKYTKMSVEELMEDIGIVEEKESEQFGIDFTKALQGELKTPSKAE